MYDLHLFACTNQKTNGKPCCADKGAVDALATIRQKYRAVAREEMKVRINQSGCLGKCGKGPAIVIYPAGDWFRYETDADLDAIVAVLAGNISAADHLRLPSD